MLPGYNIEVKYIKTSIKTSRICPVARPLFHTLLVFRYYFSPLSTRPA